MCAWSVHVRLWRRALNVILASIVFNAMSHVVFAGMRLAVALDAIHIGASSAVVGLITALFASLPAIGSVPMGRYIDRYGSRVPLLVCPILLIICPLLAALVPGLISLAVASLVTGGAFLTLHIINQQLIGRLSKPQDRPANFAIAATWIAASSALSPMLTGFAIDHIGFRWTFAILSMVSVLSIIFLSRRVPALEPRPVSEKDAGQGSVVDLLKDPKLRRIYTINVLFATAWDVFLFMTPIYGAAMKLSASQIGTIIACFSGATFFVRLLTRAVSRKFTPWQVLLISLAVSGTANLAFGLTTSVTLLMFFAFTMGLGHGLASPMMNTLFYEAAPQSRMAEVLGLRTSVSMSLQVAMPIAAGALGSVIGIAPLYWLVSALQLGGGYSARHNWKRAKGRPASPE